MENNAKYKPDPKLRLMDKVRQVLRHHHYSYRPEQAYYEWIIRFAKFHGSQKHTVETGKSEIEAFLSKLATVNIVSSYWDIKSPGSTTGGF